MKQPTTSLTNISLDGVRFRFFFGVLLFLFCFGMMALLTVAGASPVLRIAVFLPAWFSALSLLQARAALCVFHAARGTYSDESGTHRVEDAARREALMRRAGRIHLQAVVSAFVFTILLTALSLLIPWHFPPT